MTLNERNTVPQQKNYVDLFIFHPRKRHCTLNIPADASSAEHLFKNVHTCIYVIDTPSGSAADPLHTLALGNCMSLSGHSVHGRLCSFLCRKTFHFFFLRFFNLPNAFQAQQSVSNRSVSSRMFTFCSNSIAAEYPASLSPLTF